MLNTDSIFAQELYSPGYLLLDLPLEHREPISEAINSIIADTDITKDVRSILRGHISHQFDFPVTEDFKSLLIELTAQYEAKFGSHPNKKLRRNIPVYDVSTTWVNFQKKGEFSPLHTHPGDFNFVLWVRCPYDIEDEQKQYDDIKQNESAAFKLHYTDAYGSINTINLPVDKKFEWKMCFFPSSLNHSVNPFMTSDEYRISISGNLFAK